MPRLDDQVVIEIKLCPFTNPTIARFNLRFCVFIVVAILLLHRLCHSSLSSRMANLSVASKVKVCGPTE
jgi:hypothetical protein